MAKKFDSDKFLRASIELIEAFGIEVSEFYKNYVKTQAASLAMLPEDTLQQSIDGIRKQMTDAEEAFKKTFNAAVDEVDGAKAVHI